MERLMSRLTTSRAALDLIASFEGFRTRAALAPNGKWTLGFGHSVTAREGLSVTRAEAEDLLRWDLLPVEDTIRQVTLMPLSQNQFDALASFALNIGIENFKSSDVLRHLNQGQPIAAALAMHAWRLAPMNGRILTIDALVRRRAAEAAMFLETIGPRPAAPTSIVRPQTDGVSMLPSNDDEPIVGIAHNIEHQTPPMRPHVVAEKAASQLVQAETEALKGPMIRPAIDIPPLSVSNASIPPTEVPRVTTGLSPFPGAQDVMPANATSQTLSTPANDGYNTRLYGAPESIEAPKALSSQWQFPTVETVRNLPLVAWIMMAMGAALLAFGLYYSWKSSILTVSAPRPDLKTDELIALFAAASGFIILVTTSVSALTADPSETDA
jgi:GH24 family phage-related lysozyme (muramidase)